jgi:dihydroxyacetone kinase-like protein
MSLDGTWVVDWMRESARVLAENRAELGALDREIGDGDHGENMDRGFTAVLAGLETISADASPGGVLQKVAMTLISTIGGAAGPLYGTGLLKASDAAGTGTQLDGASIVALLRAARDGIVLRGKAEVGEKTMVDAWTPAVDAASAAERAGESPGGILRAAAEAASAGAEATEPLIARKGRASYLGERAIGHRDPGAQSTALLLQAAADTARNA